MTVQTDTHTSRKRPGSFRTNPWTILTALCLGFFMILLDTTIVNIAIPDLSTDLGISLDDILWILNAYVMVYAVLLITAGRLGDLYGPKPLFLCGLAIFTLASAWCGLAQGPTELVASRVAQGIGGALLTPQTLSMITVIFPAHRRGAAFGVWGAVSGIATVTGPTLGGFLVTNLGWRSVFFVNVPVGIITFVFATIVMPNLKPHRRHRLDLGGTALVTTALILIVFGLIEGESHDWSTVWGPVTIPTIIASGVGFLILFGFHQYHKRADEPLVPIDLIHNRNFSVMSLVAMAIGFSMTGLFFPLVIFLQSVLGMSALHAGLTAAPMSLVSMVIAPFSGRLADRIGGKYILLAGVTLFATGIGTIMFASTATATALTLMPGLLIAGLGLGLTFAPMQTMAMMDVPPAMAGAASGVNNTMRQLGAVIGTAATGALLQSRLSVNLDKAAQENASAISDPAIRERFIVEFHQIAHGGLQIGTAQARFATLSGLPDTIVAQISKIASATFHDGFIPSMHTTMLLPILSLSTGALICLASRSPVIGHSPLLSKEDNQK